MKIGKPTEAPSSAPPAEAETQTPKFDRLESEPAPLLAKTSPVVRVGDTVIYRTQEKSKQFNGSTDHPAIVTRDWGKCVNLKVIPDCGAPYDATSQKRINAADKDGTGYFTPGEV